MKLKNGVGDALSKSLRRCIGVDFVGDLGVITGQSTYCTNYTVKFLTCWNNAIMGRLKEVGGPLSYATACPPIMITSGYKL